MKIILTLSIFGGAQNILLLKWMTGAIPRAERVAAPSMGVPRVGGVQKHDSNSQAQDKHRAITHMCKT